MKKKGFVFALVVCILGSLFTSCSPELTQRTIVIGVLLPTTSSERWIYDGDALRTSLTAKGYKVEVRYAEDDIKLQLQQLKELLESGVHCLVVAAIDSVPLADELDAAAKRGIPVISYDRLLMNTNSISYYVSFDNKGCGTVIGEYILNKYNLPAMKDSGRSFTIEFLMGSPDDNNAVYLYNGMMEVLKPYLDNGVLKCLSGQTTFEETCILRWSEEGAYKRTGMLLDGFYKERNLDIICSAFDGFAYGAKRAFLERGFEPNTEAWPCITGQDAEIAAVRAVVDGSQSMTVFKDTRLLAAKCISMIDNIFHGLVPEINDKNSYFNGKMKVQSYLCKPVVVERDNVKPVLVDSGYYTSGIVGIEN